MLRRAPFLLRVVEEAGKWDALDQVDDDPKPTERIVVYRLADMPSGCHIRASGGRGGFYVMASYRVMDEQPPDAQVRTQAAWVQYCAKHVSLYEEFRSRFDPARNRDGQSGPDHAGT